MTLEHLVGVEMVAATTTITQLTRNIETLSSQQISYKFSRTRYLIDTLYW